MNTANLSALIYHTLNDSPAFKHTEQHQNGASVNWVGFYFNYHALESNDNSKLMQLGPFQGKVACTDIPYSSGVCGYCATNQKTIVVQDVHQFEGHIPCDSASNSEIVIPLIELGQTKGDPDRCIGVLDIDSPNVGQFDTVDQKHLESIVQILMQKQKNWFVL